MSLFGKTKSVESILEGVFAKIEELLEHSKEQHGLADGDHAEAQRLQEQCNTRRSEAIRAERIADRVRRMIEED